MKRFFLICCLLAFGAAGMAGRSPVDDLSTVNRALLNFNYFRDWSDGFNLMLLDTAAGRGSVLPELIPDQTAFPDEPRASYQERISPELGFEFEKKAESDLPPFLRNFTFFNLRGRLFLFGVNHLDRKSGGVLNAFFDLKRRRGFDPPGPMRFDWLGTSAGKSIAFRVAEPGVFYLLSRDLKQSRRIELESRLFLRRVWALSGREYLVMHWPFNSSYHFSIVDEQGRIKRSFYPAERENDSGLRAYLIDNFLMADFLDGRLYLCRVYPDDSRLELIEIDVKKGNRRIFKAEIPGFTGRHEFFRSRSLISLSGVVTAAVNGVFAAGRRVSVSLSVNELGGRREACAHYLFFFDQREAYLGRLRIPFGPVLHYDRQGGEYIARREESREKDSSNNLVLFTVKTEGRRFFSWWRRLVNWLQD